MVGIPGGSRGCATCRKRKVKCGQERPSCQNCVRSKRECEGYRRYPVFINRTVEGLAKRKRLEEVKPKQRHERVVEIVRRKDHPPAAATQFVSAYPSLDGGRNLAPLFLARAETVFFETWLPSTIGRDNGRIAWLTTIMMKPARSAALEASMKALSLTRLGRAMDDKYLLQLGGSAYSNALRELQKALWDEKIMCDDDTMAAGKICALHELFESTTQSPTAWRNHEIGMTQLLRLRGSTNYDSGFAHELFLSMRHSAMIYSLQHREASALMDAEWQDAPWSKTSKDENQILYDHGLALAAVLSDLKACQNVLQDPQQRQRKLLSCAPKLYDIAQGLDIWWLLYQNKASVSFEVSTKTYPPLEGPSTIDFNEAETTITFWSLQALVGTAGQVLSKFIPVSAIYSPESFDTASSLNYSPTQLSAFLAQDFETLCISSSDIMVQIAERLLQPEMGLLGPQMTIMPLKVAQTTYQRLNHPGLEKCDILFSRLATDKGLGFARDLRNLGLSPSHRTRELNFETMKPDPEPLPNPQRE